MDQTQLNNSRMWAAINKAEQADESLRRQIHNSTQIINLYDGRLVMNNDTLPSDLPTLTPNVAVQYCPYFERLDFIGFQVLSVGPKPNVRDPWKVKLSIDWIAFVSTFSDDPVVSHVVTKDDDAIPFSISRDCPELHGGYQCEFEVEDLLLRFPGVCENILRDMLFLAWLLWDAELGSQWVPN